MTDVSEAPLSQLFAETERNLASLHGGHFSLVSSYSHRSSAADSHAEHKEALPLPSAAPRAPSSSSSSSSSSSRSPPAQGAATFASAALSDADYKLEAFSLLLTSLRSSLRSDLSLLASSVAKKTAALRAQLTEFTEDAVRESAERLKVAWDGRDVDRQLEMGEWKKAVEEELRDVERRVEDDEWAMRAKKEDMARALKAVERALKETRAHVEQLQRAGEERPAGAGASAAEGGAAELKRVREEMAALSARQGADAVEVRHEVEERWLSLHALLQDMRAVVDVLMTKEEKEWERRRAERDERKAALTTDLRDALRAELSDVWAALRDTKRHSTEAEERAHSVDKRVEEFESRLVRFGSAYPPGASTVPDPGSRDIGRLEQRLRAQEERLAAGEDVARVRAEEDERRWEQRFERVRQVWEREWSARLQAQQVEVEALRLQLHQRPDTRTAQPDVNGSRGKQTSEWDGEDDAEGVEEEERADPAARATFAASESERRNASRLFARVDERVNALETRLSDVESGCQRELRQVQSVWTATQRDGTEARESEQRAISVREAEVARESAEAVHQRQDALDSAVRTINDRLTGFEDSAAVSRAQQQREDDQRQSALHAVQAQLAACDARLQRVVERLDEGEQRTVTGLSAASSTDAFRAEILRLQDSVAAVEDALRRHQAQQVEHDADVRQQLHLHRRAASNSEPVARPAGNVPVDGASAATTASPESRALAARPPVPAPAVTAAPQAVAQTAMTRPFDISAPTDSGSRSPILPTPSPATLRQDRGLAALSRPPLPVQVAAAVFSPTAQSTRPSAQQGSVASAPSRHLDVDHTEELGADQRDDKEDSDWDDEVEEDVADSRSSSDEEDDVVRFEADSEHTEQRHKREQADAETTQRLTAERTEAQERAEQAEEERSARDRRSAAQRALEDSAQQEKAEEAEAAKKATDPRSRQRTASADGEERSRTAQPQQLRAAVDATQAERKPTASTPAVPSRSRQPPVSVLATHSESSSDEDGDDGERQATPALSRPPERSPELRPPALLSGLKRSGLVSALGTRRAAMAAPLPSSPSPSSASPPLPTASSALHATSPPLAVAGIVPGGARPAASAAPHDELDQFDLDLDIDSNDFLDTSSDFYIE